MSQLIYQAASKPPPSSTSRGHRPSMAWGGADRMKKVHAYVDPSSSSLAPFLSLSPLSIPARMGSWGGGRGRRRWRRGSRGEEIASGPISRGGEAGNSQLWVLDVDQIWACTLGWPSEHRIFPNQIPNPILNWITAAAATNTVAPLPPILGTKGTYSGIIILRVFTSVICVTFWVLVLWYV